MPAVDDEQARSLAAEMFDWYPLEGLLAVEYRRDSGEPQYAYHREFTVDAETVMRLQALCLRTGKTKVDRVMLPESVLREMQGGDRTAPVFTLSAGRPMEVWAKVQDEINAAAERVAAQHVPF